MDEVWSDPGGRIQLSWQTDLYGSTNVDFRVNDSGGTGPWAYHRNSALDTNHVVVLNNLTPVSRRWELIVWSYHPRDGYCASSDQRTLFHTPERTDLTPNSIGSIEAYTAMYGRWLICPNGVVIVWGDIQYHLKAATAGEFIYDASVDRTSYYIHTRLEADTGTPFSCWVDTYLALQRSNITVYIRDKTSGVTDFFGGVDHYWLLSQIGTATKVRFSANLGGSAAGGSFGIGVTLDPGDGPTLNHRPDYNRATGGWKQMGWFDTTWTGTKVDINEVLWRVDLVKLYAEKRLRDDIEIRVDFDFYFAVRQGPYWWGGATLVKKSIVLGDNTPYDINGGDFDYWFDVLTGHVSLE